MAAYPTSPAFVTVSRSLTFQTNVQTSEDGTEQRWPPGMGEERFILGYPRLSVSDRDVLLDFFAQSKGSFDETTTFTFNSVNYTGMYIDSDRISCQETMPGYVSMSVTLCKRITAGQSGTLPATFPTLSTGAAVQLPYTHEQEILNNVVRTEGGRYVWNRKPTPIRTWSVGGSVLSDAEALAIWDQFRMAYGRWRTFNFADPDSGTVYTARFAQDSLTWVYNLPNVNQVQAQLVSVA